MWWCISGQEFLQNFPSLWAPDPFSNYRDDSILGRIVISLNSPQLQEMNVKIPPQNPLLLDWIYLHDTESWPRDHLKELEQHQHYLVSSITSAQQRLTTLTQHISPSSTAMDRVGALTATWDMWGGQWNNEIKAEVRGNSNRACNLLIEIPRELYSTLLPRGFAWSS